MSAGERDPAAGRYAIISLTRLGGAVLVMLGILAARGALSVGVGLGYLMLALGLIGFFIVPQILARRWRSPKSAQNQGAQQSPEETNKISDKA